MAKDEELNDNAYNLYNKVISSKNLSVDGAEIDEMNIAHIVIGIIFFFEYLSYKKINTNIDNVINLFKNIISKSIDNQITNWYCDKVFMHNHCFWLLLMRILICKFLIDHDAANEDINLLYQKSLKKYEHNLEFIAQVGDGSFYEGTSYGTYVATAISIYILFHTNNFGGRKFKSNPWLRNFSNFISSMYSPASHYAYSIGDAPFNWTSGPEHQIQIFDIYCGNEKKSTLLSKIHENRNKTHSSNFYNRSLFDFINLNYAYITYFDSSEKISNQFESIQRYDEIGVLAINGVETNIFINYGKYGGSIVGHLSSHNIGHSYPSIGGVTYIHKDLVYLSGPLYQKPKLTKMHPVAVFKKNDITYGQIGSSDQLEKKASWLNPTSKKYPYSPIYLIRQLENYLIFKIIINNYEISGLSWKRYLICLSSSIIIIDLFDNKSDSDIIAMLNYPFVSKSEIEAVNLLESEKNILTFFHFNEQAKISIEINDCHGDKYAIASRVIEKNLLQNQSCAVIAHIGNSPLLRADIKQFEDSFILNVISNNDLIDEHIYFAN